MPNPQQGFTNKSEPQQGFRLIRSAIQNPVTVTVGVFFVILFGLIALFRIPVQLTPEIQEVEIQVEMIWPGASPQEVEQEIIEEQVNS